MSKYSQHFQPTAFESCMTNHEKLLSICSSSRLEGADSGLDNFQERTAGIFDGRRERCGSTSSGGAQQGGWLHSGGHRGQSHSGYRPACG